MASQSGVVVFQQLRHLRITPDILTLVIRDDVEAFLERIRDAVFVVFDSFGHGF
jgi:hypothetical protein